MVYTKYFSVVQLRWVVTGGIDTMLGHCWPSVEDAGPTMTHHCVNVSCLLGSSYHTTLLHQSTFLKQSHVIQYELDVLT